MKLRPLRARAEAVVVAAGAVAALLSPGAPTGLAVPDAALRVAFVVVVAGAAARAHRTAWLAAAAVAATAAGDVAVAAAAFVVVGAAVLAALRRGRWRRPLRLLWGVGLALVLLRLEWPPLPGGTAAMAALSASILGRSWCAAAARRERQRARTVVVLGGAAVGLLLLLAAFALVAVRPQLAVGLSAAERGLAAAQAGEVEEAAEQFERGSRAWSGVHGTLSAAWLRPARLVPVVGRFLADGEELTQTGQAALAAARDVAATTASSLRIRQGGVAVAAVEDVTEQLRHAVVALDAARATVADPAAAAWYPGPLDRRMDRLADRLRRAVGDAETALQVSQVAPALLGAEGERRYFLAIQTPVEQRAAGGLIGNYGEIVASNGRLRLDRFGRIRDLNDHPGAATRALPPDVAEVLHRYPPSFNVVRYFQNATLSPDFPTDARAMEALYPQSGGRDVAGVISVDPVALSALLQLTGPVRVPTWPEPIDHENAEQVLFYDQYVTLQGEEREDFLGDVARAVIDRLTSGDLGSPAALARALGPAIAGRHLLVHAADPDEQAVLDRLDVSGALPPDDGGDFLRVVTHNMVENKIDWFLQRDVTYDATFDPASREVQATVEVTLQNNAPPGPPDYVIGGLSPSLPPAGHHRVWLSVYSALDLVRADRSVSRERELDRNVYATFVDIPPQSETTVRLELEGVISWDEYRLTVGVQPQVNPDRLTVRVNGRTEFHGVQGQQQQLGVAFS